MDPNTLTKSLRTAEQFFKIVEEQKMSEQPAPAPSAGQPLSNALKESAFQYIALLLILLSNFYGTNDWNTFFALALAFAVFIFSGWVKKIAELKINELIAQSGLKDREIQTLKEVRAKLESELRRLTEKLTDLSNSK